MLRHYPEPEPRLIPAVDLPRDNLARLVEMVVEQSVQLERLCSDSLACLFLTRGDTPSCRTLGTARVAHRALLEECWCTLPGLSEEIGLRRLGRVVLDSTKVRADVSGEPVARAWVISRRPNTNGGLPSQRRLRVSTKTREVQPWNGRFGPERTHAPSGP